MMIGDRIREIREAKKLSQGDIEKRTGLLRCYVSRVENGHTVPAVETLEKLHKHWKCQSINSSTMAITVPKHFLRRTARADSGAVSEKNARYFHRLKRCLARMSPEERDLVMFTQKGTVRKKK
jgi:transcriptional regulator with XRE-family HTH domain